MKRILFILFSLTAVFLTAVLSSCSGDAEDGEVTSLPLDGWQSFTILRPDNAAPEEISAAIALRNAVTEKTGVTLELTTDWVNRGETPPTGLAEILVGSTNREESKSDLLYNDWEVEFVGGRIAIRGGSPAKLNEAMEWFTANCVDPNGLRYPSERYGVYGEYPMRKVEINGVKLSDFDVRTADAELSERLCAFLADNTGVLPSKKAEHTITLAKSDELATFEVAAISNGKDISLGTNKIELEEAFIMFTEVLKNRSGDSLDALDERRVIEVVDFNEGRAKLDEVNSLADKRIAEIRNTPSDYKPGEGGTVYYVSNKGNDTNDGKSAAAAKKTPGGLPTLKAGDVVLFERGGLWREYFKTVSGVTYSAYGEGDKPMFFASPENGADPSKWSLLEGTDNIWVYAAEMMDVGNLIFNDGESYASKALPIWKDGKFLVKDTMTEFDPAADLTEDLRFFSKADSLFKGNTAPVSDTGNVGELYLRCDKGNPGELYDSIEFLIRRNGIGLAGDNVIIDNLCVKYVGAHGIGGGTVGKVTIRNCEIGWIGGGVQYYTPAENQVVRYGNGIEVYGGCDSYTIENCYVYDCYDAGITHQYQKGGTNAVTDSNVTYKNNIIERCAYNIEYFMGAVDSGSADRKMNNILICGNILRDSGKSFGARAHSVDIIGWGHRNEAYGFVIENNIFANAEHRTFYIGASDQSWHPTFRNNTYVMKYGGRFAFYGVNGKMAESSYTENFDKKVSEITGETDGKYYYIEN